MTSNRHANDRREFLKNLRQSRRFLDRPVPQDIVDDLIAAARTVRDGEDPASWQFLVIDDLATKQALSGVGAFTEFLANVAVAIVVVVNGDGTPSKANVEGRIADRIMLAAGHHGLGGGSGWFGADDAQARARDILGLPGHRQVLVVVGVGYVDESAPGEESSSLQRVRKSLDDLAGNRKPRDRNS